MSGKSCKFVIVFPLPMIIYLFHATQNQSLRAATGPLVRTPSSKPGSTVIIFGSQLDIVCQFLFLLPVH